MGITVDLFAGGGGASTGLEAAMGSVAVAVNHSPIAIAVHELNHPETTHYVSDVFEVDPVEATGDDHIDALWASPDCTHFSRARGSKPRKQNIRALAEVILDWADAKLPDRIFVENVEEFQSWGPLDDEGMPIKAQAGTKFAAWVAHLEQLGYVVEWRVLNAADFGAPTSRKRLFIIARRDGVAINWPEPTHGPTTDQPYRTAAECIDWDLDCPSIFDRSKPLAEKTCRRIAAGVMRYVVEAEKPFVVPEAGGTPFFIDRFGERDGQAPRSRRVDRPMPTLCSTGHQGSLVTAFIVKHYGGVVGHEVERPLGTITAQDHHGVVEVEARREFDEDKARQVWAFLVKFYGNSDAQSIETPLGTITTNDRFALVVVEGEEYVITDIGMRMLQPHELLKAQFGDFAEGYNLDATKIDSRGRERPISKKDQMRLIGNSVCPQVAHAIAAANTEGN